MATFGSDKTAGRLARFRSDETTTHYGRATDLSWDSPHVIEGRTVFRSTVGHHPDMRALVSGINNPKIGKRVEKGPWSGWPIYMLTLEERATCPRSCHHWRTCYGSNMHMARRNAHGPVLEDRLQAELALLQDQHPDGFVVRLHVLGDFYSEGYVGKWATWLDRFPALHVFGYSAWPLYSPIGAAVRWLAIRRWDRFAVRLSVPHRQEGHREAVTWWGSGDLPAEHDDAIMCPGQRHATETCGTCGLCWGTSRNIAFAVHGRRMGRLPKAEEEKQEDPVEIAEEITENPPPAPVSPPAPSPPAPPYGLELSRLERRIYDQMRPHHRVTAKDICEDFGMHRVTVLAALRGLAAEGLVTKEGDRRSARWFRNGAVAPAPAPAAAPVAAEPPSAPPPIVRQAAAADQDWSPLKARGPTHAPALAGAGEPIVDSHPLDDHIRSLAERGCTAGEIAAAVGRSPLFVGQRVTALGLRLAEGVVA